MLAEFLALDMIPQAYRPTPRQREHRALVRHRQFLQKERTQLRIKVRRIVSDYNADRRDLFSRRGLEHLAAVPLNASDRFIVAQMLDAAGGPGGAAGGAAAAVAGVRRRGPAGRGARPAGCCGASPAWAR